MRVFLMQVNSLLIRIIIIRIIANHFEKTHAPTKQRHHRRTPNCGDDRIGAQRTAGPVQHSSGLLDVNSGPGALLSPFTGYRRRPSLMLLAIYASNWIGAIVMQRRLCHHA
ncbi:MAG TPA: hypothetical protein DEQ40_10880 [Oxalobacteraceae bacterium]|jgi:hypothetical protein|nr:hypothetical protein [Oxalobacteraceae bacterium]